VPTSLPFASRVALVTGGGKGLGACIARRLAEGGAKVAVTGREAAALESVAQATKGVAIQADATDAAAMARAVARVREELGPIAIVVHNAGIAPSAPLERTEDDVWEKTMAVNVTAAFRLARAVMPEMARAGFGRVINIASNAGLRGYAYTAAYCASKHALVGLTRALAVEFAKTHVTINAVCPGFLETEMTARTIETIRGKTGRSEADARKFLEDLSPQKRLIQVDEVAHLVAMLCDETARGINGQAIAIDGGQVTSAQ
jgi:NAD(P)-dependent dehydrogenase (short-subunit alcohol dehydrogenase family)